MKHEDLKRLHARLLSPDQDHEGVCPAPHALEDLARSVVSPARRERLEAEVRRCPECARDLQVLVDGLTWFEQHEDTLLKGVRARLGLVEPAGQRPATLLMDASERVARALGEMLEGFHRLLQGQTLQAAPATGLRSGSAEILEARADFDDGASEPVLRFRAARREIESGGRLVIELSTADPVPAGVVRLEAALRQGARRIVLPSCPLLPDGRATIVSRLPVAPGAFLVLPPGAVELRFLKQESSGG